MPVELLGTLERLLVHLEGRIWLQVFVLALILLQVPLMLDFDFDLVRGELHVLWDAAAAAVRVAFRPGLVVAGARLVSWQSGTFVWGGGHIAVRELVLGCSDGPSRLH